MRHSLANELAAGLVEWSPTVGQYVADGNLETAVACRTALAKKTGPADLLERVESAGRVGEIPGSSAFGFDDKYLQGTSHDVVCT